MDAKNAKREATLKQALDWHRDRAAMHFESGDHADFARHRAFADAIDAHLSRAAEPVATILPQDPEFPAPEADLPIFSATAWKRLGALPPRTNLYTLSPESARDAKDAARLDWLSDRYMQASDAVDRELGLPSGMCSLREAIDAAMAQEH